MDCPHTSKEMPPLPPSEAPPNEIQAFTSPQETMSLVSGPSSNGKTSFSSPLKAVDLGVPETPEQRQLIDVDGMDIEDGYDSDGLQAPWEGSKLAIFDLREAEESPLPFGPPPVSSEVPPVQNVAEKILTVEDVPKMKVSDINRELKLRGLVVRGKKADLVIRLQEAIKNKVPLVENMTGEKAANLAGESFSPGAYWEHLPCTGDFVIETRQEGFRGPTEPEGEISRVKKRNFTQKFD